MKQLHINSLQIETCELDLFIFQTAFNISSLLPDCVELETFAIGCFLILFRDGLTNQNCQYQDLTDPVPDNIRTWYWDPELGTEYPNPGVETGCPNLGTGHPDLGTGYFVPFRSDSFRIQFLPSYCSLFERSTLVFNPVISHLATRRWLPLLMELEISLKTPLIINKQILRKDNSN